MYMKEDTKRNLQKSSGKASSKKKKAETCVEAPLCKLKFDQTMFSWKKVRLKGGNIRIKKNLLTNT